MTLEALPLFKVNNHSDYAIIYRRTPLQLQKELSKLVFARYPVKRVFQSSIAQVSEKEEASNNFRIKAIWSNSKPRTILLRKNIRVVNRERLVFLQKTLRFLNDKHLSAPQIIETNAGWKTFEYKGNYWEAYEFINGNHYRGTRSELVNFASGLGKLHRALQTFPYKKELRKYRRSHFLPPWSMKQMINLIRAALKRNKTDIDKLFFQYQSLLYDIGKDTNSRFSSIKRKRLQIIHGDLHPHNTIFLHGSLRAILDYEMIQEAELLRDVGFAAHRFSRQYAAYNRSGIKGVKEGFKLFIKAYSSINPLTKTEINQLPIFIKDELMRRIIRDFSLYYFQHDDRYASVPELKKKITLLQEAQLLF